MPTPGEERFARLPVERRCRQAGAIARHTAMAGPDDRATRLCGYLAVAWASAIVQSARSRTARDQTLEEEHRCDWTMTTIGLLLFVLWKSVTRRMLASRALAADVFVAFTDRLAPQVAADFRDTAGQLHHDMCNGCPVRRVGGLCRCVHTLAGNL